METFRVVMEVIYYTLLAYLLLGVMVAGIFWLHMDRKHRSGKTSHKDEYLMRNLLATTCAVILVYPIIFWFAAQAAVGWVKEVHERLTSPKPPNRTKA